MNNYMYGIEKAAYLLLRVGSKGITNSEAAYTYDLLNFNEHAGALKRRHNLHTDRLADLRQVRYRIANKSIAMGFINLINHYRRQRGGILISGNEILQLISAFPDAPVIEGD